MRLENAGVCAVTGCARTNHSYITEEPTELCKQTCDAPRTLAASITDLSPPYGRTGAAALGFRATLAFPVLLLLPVAANAAAARHIVPR